MNFLNPYVKAGSVFIVCLCIAYVNFLLLNELDFNAALRSSEFLLVGAVIYGATIFFFASFFYSEKRYLLLVVWLVFNASLVVNMLIHLTGDYPPTSIQYMQSGSLLVFAVLLAFTKTRFPNWMQLFSLACLLVLIPCLICYFAGLWYWYERTVYVLCFTPMILSGVFLKRPSVSDNPEIIDQID